MSKKNKKVEPTKLDIGCGPDKKGEQVMEKQATIAQLEAKLAFWQNARWEAYAGEWRRVCDEQVHLTRDELQQAKEREQSKAPTDARGDICPHCHLPKWLHSELRANGEHCPGMI